MRDVSQEIRDKIMNKNRLISLQKDEANRIESEVRKIFGKGFTIERNSFDCIYVKVIDWPVMKIYVSAYKSAVYIFSDKIIRNMYFGEYHKNKDVVNVVRKVALSDYFQNGIIRGSSDEGKRQFLD